MPKQSYSFKVRQSAGAPVHEVTIRIPESSDLTVKQHETAWENAVDGMVIKVQGTLRRALEKGERGEQLAARAQAAFDAILNATPRGMFVVMPTIDCRVAKLTRAQQPFVTGVILVNADWEDEVDTDEPNDELESEN